MRSSISNFELVAIRTTPTVRTKDVYRAWSFRTLISLALFCIALEGLTRFGFRHISHIEARISNDHRAAQAIRRTGPPTVLFVGNSLLLEGLNLASLRDSLAGQAQVVSFSIEQTEYLDWFYGLRRLFADGSQPELVVLCMSAGHLISPRIRGDYSAYYLFRAREIPQIGRDVHYDLTKTSSLLLSRFSLFYAGRTPLRNFVLVRIDPSYGQMLQQIAGRPAASLPGYEIERIAAARLSALRQLCSVHDARFAFLLAPGFGSDEAPVVKAGIWSQTDVMVPIHLNQLGRDKFRDGFHLNAAGAQLFTNKVAPVIKSRLQADGLLQ